MSRLLSSLSVQGMIASAWATLALMRLVERRGVGDDDRYPHFFGFFHEAPLGVAFDGDHFAAKFEQFLGDAVADFAESAHDDVIFIGGCHSDLPFLAARLFIGEGDAEADQSFCQGGEAQDGDQEKEELQTMLFGERELVCKKEHGKGVV